MKNTKSKVFKEVDEFILQLRDLGNVEMHHDPASKQQKWAAVDVADSIREYEEATRTFRETVTQYRDQMKGFTEAMAEDIANYDDQKLQDVLKVSDIVIKRNIEILWTKRYKAALSLIDHITNATALGVIHPAEGLLEKLKECQEEKRILSKQILEYKARLSLR